MTQVATTAAGWSRFSLSANDTSRHGAYWQHIVLSRVALCRSELAGARNRDPGQEDAVWQRVEDLLDAAEHSARQPGSRLRLWLGGGAINRAFVNLHAAHVLLARNEPDDTLPAKLHAAMVRVQDTMPDGPRREYLEQRYAASTGPDATADAQRGVLERALEWSYNTTDAQYARLRSFRNVLSGVSLSLIVLLVGLAVMGVLWPESLQLCFAVPDGRACPTGAAATPKDAVIIQVLGAAGGALAAVLTVSRMQGTSTPYSVPLALAMLKLPVGALTALLGLVLIHGQFIPGLDNLDSSGQILAYAVVLGVAQHAATKFVDKRGEQLLAGIPAKHGTGPAENGGTKGTVVRRTA